MKTCTKCGTEYPATLEFFSPDKRRTDGLYSRCRKCHNKVQREYRKQNPEQVKKYHREYQRKYYKTFKGRLRAIFCAINNRCTNSKNPRYKDYGGRSIENKFNSPNDFIECVINLGYNTYRKLKGLQIDRINNNGHYEKDNIRFVTAKVNANNRRK